MVEKEEKASVEEICPMCIFAMPAMRESRKHMLDARRNFLLAVKTLVDAELERTDRLLAKKHNKKLKKIEVK